MLQYIIQHSACFRVFLEADSLSTQPTQSPSRISNVSSDPLITETTGSQENSAYTFSPVEDVKPMSAQNNTEVAG